MPRWVHPNIFAFLCPHCREVFLSCKNVVMERSQQAEIFAEDAIGASGATVVLTRPEFAWNFPTGADFRTLTVTPSINAEAAGHWHGHVTAGEIQ